MDNPSSSSSASDLNKIINDQQMELGTLSVIKSKLSVAETKISALTSEMSKLQQMTAQRRRFYEFRKNTDLAMLEKLRSELHTILGNLHLDRIEVLSLQDTIEEFKSDQNQLKSLNQELLFRLKEKNGELSALEKSEFTLQANFEETQQSLQNAEKIIAAQKCEIQKLNKDLTEGSTSFGYKALCALPGIVKTGVKFTGTTVVAVEISGRLGLHRYRPLTSSCKKVKGGVKKLYGKIRSKKKTRIPSEFQPPVLQQRYHSVVSVDVNGPPSVSRVPVDVDM